MSVLQEADSLDNRGQGEAEAISILSIAGLLFIIVLMLSINYSSSISSAKGAYGTTVFCRNIVSIIENMNSLQGSQSISFYSERDFNISGQSVIIGGYSCRFSGRAAYANVLSGDVTAGEDNGRVVFENA
jgi:hypothetical protein